PLLQIRPFKEFLRSIGASVEEHSSTTHDSWPLYRQWDWNKKTFVDNPLESTSSGISIHWCRRDDGPDRYKLYREGALLWWTRSRNWAILAAFTLAGVPLFARELGTSIESYADGPYLPLPAARVVAWIGRINPGPVKLSDGTIAYRYTFPDQGTRDAI